MGATGGFPQNGRLREHHTRRDRLGPWGRYNPLIRGERVDLRQIDDRSPSRDEASPQRPLENELSWEQKSISCSSPQRRHGARSSRTVSILNESERGLMQCPLDVPLVQFGRQVRRPRRWFHTCSGEHAAVLRGMRLLGIRRAGYTLPKLGLVPLVHRRPRGNTWRTQRPGAQTGLQKTVVESPTTSGLQSMSLGHNVRKSLPRGRTRIGSGKRRTETQI